MNEKHDMKKPDCEGMEVTKKKRNKKKRHRKKRTIFH
jgi:hypothetical protein